MPQADFIDRRVAGEMGIHHSAIDRLMQRWWRRSCLGCYSFNCRL